MFPISPTIAVSSATVIVRRAKGLNSRLRRGGLVSLYLSLYTLARLPLGCLCGSL